MYKIGLITTLDINIGDDLVRKGIIRIVNDILGPNNVVFLPVNKHKPETIGPSFDDCDYIIQCGAPVLWNGCHKCEWATSVWYDTIGKLYQRTPVLNIGAGSCYSFKNIPSTLESRDVEYIRKIHSYCALTTVRDDLANTLLSDLSIKSTLLPCPSLVAAHNFSDVAEGPVVVNYMHKGGHYDFDGRINPTKWYMELKAALSSLSKDNKLLMLCHTKEEMNLAASSFPEYDRVLATTAEDLISIALKSKFGILNRLHAAVALASVGVPCIAIGNDTRLFMTKYIGIPIYDVSEISSTLILKETELMSNNTTEFKERINTLKNSTYTQYINILKDIIK